MRNLVVVLLVCFLVFAGQAQAQICGCGPVIIGPPIYVEPAPSVVIGPPIYHETAPLVYVGPPMIHYNPRQRVVKTPELIASSETVQVDGHTNAVRRKVPRANQPPPERVRIQTTDFGTRQRTVSFLQEVQVYDVEVTVTIPMVEQTVTLTSYEETKTYRDGRLYEIYWRGWDASPTGNVHWEEEVRFIDGRKKWIIPHRRIQQREPTLAPLNRPTMDQ